MFPDIVKKIPTKDYGIDGLEVHSDHTSTGTIYYVYAAKEVAFPRHSHAAQYTIVVSGECKFSANGETKIYKKGDTYLIPEGLEHQITLGAGYAEIDYVDDPKDGD